MNVFIIGDSLSVHALYIEIGISELLNAEELTIYSLFVTIKREIKAT